jgi:hypothetical protein
VESQWAELVQLDSQVEEFWLLIGDVVPGVEHFPHAPIIWGGLRGLIAVGS